VPRISAFHGIVIWMYYEEGAHSLPHFHARYAGRTASFALDGEVLAGELPARPTRLTREWAALHQEELLANWNKVRCGESVVPVPPLA